MSNTNGHNQPPRISVSQELLRAELNELKLWMLTTFAPRSEVDDLRKEVRVLQDEAVTREALQKATNLAQKHSNKRQNIMTGVIAAAITLVTGLKEAGIF